MERFDDVAEVRGLSEEGMLMAALKLHDGPSECFVEVLIDVCEIPPPICSGGFSLPSLMLCAWLHRLKSRFKLIFGSFYEPQLQNGTNFHKRS